MSCEKHGEKLIQHLFFVMKRAHFLEYSFIPGSVVYKPLLTLFDLKYTFF